MLTVEKYNKAAAIAATEDNSSAVVAEYITMPASLRRAVTDQVRQEMQEAGFSPEALETYVDQNRRSLKALAEKNTMSLTSLTAFLLDRLEEDAARQAESGSAAEASNSV